MIVERRLTKAQLFQLVGYQIHSPEVLAYHESTARWKAAVSPARTSKSWASSHDKLYNVFPTLEIEIDDETGAVIGVWPKGKTQISTGIRGSLGWIVAPDYKLCKEFQYLWDILVLGGQRFHLPLNVKRAINNPDQGNMKIILTWGHDREGNEVQSIVEGKSATNERSLQAEEVDWCIMSEAADQVERILTKYLETRCGEIDFPTTPKIHAAWLKSRIDQAMDDPELDMESFKFNPTCNPSYDYDRYWTAHQKAESRVTGEIITRPVQEEDRHVRHELRKQQALDHCFSPTSKCMAMKDPEFGEQFGGLWTFDAERAIPFRWEGANSNVCQQLPPWFDEARKFVSTDHGFDHPAVAGWFAVGPEDEVVMYRELYERRLTPDEFVRQIKERTPRHEVIEYHVGDPQNPSVRAHFTRLGLPMTAMNSGLLRDRKAGHMTVCDYLSINPVTGRPGITIYEPVCPMTVNELKLLRIKPDARDEYSKGSLHGRDDAYDMIRYFLMTNPHGTKERKTWDRMEEMRQEVIKSQRRKAVTVRGGLRGRTPHIGA